MSYQSPSSSPLLSPSAVSTMLDVKVGTLAVWRCNGKYNLPYVKIGSRVMYRAEDVNTFISGQVHIHTARKKTLIKREVGA